MKERPILFSDPMVRAILADLKTQTRRVMKPQPVCAGTSNLDRFESHIRWWDDKDKNADGVYINEQEVWMPTSPSGKIGIFKPYFYICPYGVVGDRLWVREAWAPTHGSGSHEHPLEGYCYFEWDADLHGELKDGAPDLYLFYRADGVDKLPAEFDMPDGSEIRWRPSIFMYRWASRIDLEIKKIRVERLQDISEEDAKAEGIRFIERDKYNGQDFWGVEPGLYNSYGPNAKTAFMHLWDSINANPNPRYGRDETGKKVITHYESYPWEDVQETRTLRGKPWHVYGNPWNWVVDFKRKC